jgi:hypothetical protein
VGLAWRPKGEPICCEIYSTGRANLPGSVVERDLLSSFSRMLPELLRFSSSAHLLEAVPEELRAAHRAAEADEQPESEPLAANSLSEWSSSLPGVGGGELLALLEGA